jgi:hypothetical protein
MANREKTWARVNRQSVQTKTRSIGKSGRNHRSRRGRKTRQLG